MESIEGSRNGQIVNFRRSAHTEPQAMKDDHSTLVKRNTASPDNELNDHCDFFDLDSDGIIWPLDTFQVCRAWGWSLPVALFFAGAIHFVQSYGTTPGKMPDPFWRIWKNSIYRNKHGSSTMSFSKDGELMESHLHSFFMENDEDKKGGLTIWQLWSGLKKQALPFDLFGQVSNFFEWFFAYLLIWPNDGVLREADSKCICDGSIFRVKAEGSRKQLRGSSLFVRQVLSLLIVNTIVLPAVYAGMCYFVLRAVDDIFGLWKCGQRKNSKTREKNWTGRSYASSSSEEKAISTAGIAGILIIVGIAKLITSLLAWIEKQEHV